MKWLLKIEFAGYAEGGMECRVREKEESSMTPGFMNYSQFMGCSFEKHVIAKLKSTLSTI